MEQTQSLTNRQSPDPAARLRLANELFRQYYVLCFWHLKPDLIVTEKTLPIVIKGLRLHGGRRGMLAAARILDE